MKQLKKLASLLLAMVMVFGLAATALATGEPQPSSPSETPSETPTAPIATENKMEGEVAGGSITVTNAVEGQKYSIYQIMYQLTAAEGSSAVYAPNSIWAAWLRTQTKYVTFDEAGNVTVNAGTDLATFGKLALAYARGNNFTPCQTLPTADTKEATSPTVEFTGLKRGYYLVDPTTNAIALNSDNTDITTEVTTAKPIMQGDLTGGSITINNAVQGHTYSAYQLMYLESYNATNGAYSYKANSYWDTFLRGVVTDGDNPQHYVTIDTQGYVTWHTPDGMSQDQAAAEFAKKALKYAKDNGIQPVSQTLVEATSTAVVFPNLNLGYYLLDSTLGTLCSLDTTNPAVTMQEKNAKPTNDKQVQEDSTGSYGKVNDAEIGETVDFRSKVTLPEGSENVVYHDTMSAGLDLVTTEDSIKVYTDEAMNTELDSANYTVNTTPTNNHCTFEVTFNKNYLDSLSATATVYVKYSATVNANAVIGDTGNENTSQLSYGDEGNTQYTPGSTTKTYVWEFEVNKTAGDTGSPMSNVEFVLLNSDKTKVATFTDRNIDFEITNEEGQKETITVSYRIFNAWVDLPSAVNGAIPYTNWNDNMKLVTDTDGKIHVGGLDSDTTYYLREIKTADGYNMVGDTEFVIESSVNDTNDGMAQKAKIISIVNNKGDELPTTGGIGTTIFYVVGSILLVGAVVLLVVKKRMSVSK